MRGDDGTKLGIVEGICIELSYCVDSIDGFTPDPTHEMAEDLTLDTTDGNEDGC